MIADFNLRLLHRNHTDHIIVCNITKTLHIDNNVIGSTLLKKLLMFFQ